MGVDVDFKDITKDPPPRAFLEQHVAADRFTDFLSHRSPVWRERPLPDSKHETIDIMLEQPNLIKRPVLVAGRKVIFGFDAEEYRRTLS